MSDALKHTPGPWEVRKSVADRYLLPGTHQVAVITRSNDLDGSGHLLMVNGDYHVCKFNPTTDPLAVAKMTTDAHLIAAAPELLEAARLAFYREAGLTLALKVQSNGWAWPDDAPDRVSPLAESLRVAIAKATTRSQADEQVALSAPGEPK